MKTDDFEKRLQRQTPREIPAAWREEIISASRDASRTSAASIWSKPAITSFVFNLWRELICPARRVWAGLAAAWVLIFIANANMRSDRPSASAYSTTKAADIVFMFREQNQLLAELTGPAEVKRTEPAIPPATKANHPRSERITKSRMA